MKSVRDPAPKPTDLDKSYGPKSPSDKTDSYLGPITILSDKYPIAHQIKEVYNIGISIKSLSMSPRSIKLGACVLTSTILSANEDQ
jgi:hypothetical protein